VLEAELDRIENLRADLVHRAVGLIAVGTLGDDVVERSWQRLRIAELLHADPEIRAPAQPARLPEPARGELQFEHVTFHYPTRRETSALDDFSLSVRTRERLAIVGPSGAGKSTLFQLAERFYDPDRGRILLDGIDLKDADPADIRQRIALVLKAIATGKGWS